MAKDFFILKDFAAKEKKVREHYELVYKDSDGKRIKLKNPLTPEEVHYLYMNMQELGRSEYLHKNKD